MSYGITANKISSVTCPHASQPGAMVPPDLWQIESPQHLLQGTLPTATLIDQGDQLPL